MITSEFIICNLFYQYIFLLSYISLSVLSNCFIFLWLVYCVMDCRRLGSFRPFAAKFPLVHNTATGRFFCVLGTYRAMTRNAGWRVDVVNSGLTSQVIKVAGR